MTSGMRRLFRHLCLVNSHYHKREKARHGLLRELENPESDKLKHRVNKLLDAEVKVASLGKKKKYSSDIGSLEPTLTEEIVEIRKHIGDKGVGRRIRSIEKKVDVKLREKILKDIDDQIFFLESKITTIQKDKSYNKIRVRNLKNKIRRLKTLIKNLL